MIENHSFSYPTWEKLSSEKYNSIATELKQFGSTIFRRESQFETIFSENLHQ